MKLSDYITVTKVKTETETGYRALFTDEEPFFVAVPLLPVQPTKQMAVQALIDNAILARRPVDPMKQP